MAAGGGPGRLSERVRRRIAADYPPVLADRVTAALDGLDLAPWAIDADPAGRERILAGLLIVAGGDLAKLGGAIALARTDWRDLLVAAGLEGEDWRERVDAYLGAAG